MFDALERQLGPTINEAVQNEDMAALIALSRRSRAEIDKRFEQMSRRALHVLNLPAGSDVNRLLDHIARLEREVRDLRNTISDRENAEFLAELEARHATKQAAANKQAAKKPAAKRQAAKKPAAKKPAAAAKKPATKMQAAKTPAAKKRAAKKPAAKMQAAKKPAAKTAGTTNE